MFVCWFLIFYPILTVLASWEHKIVLHIKKSKQKQFCVPVLQTFSNLGKFLEINKQFHVKSWLTYQSYSSVWWILSCTDVPTKLHLNFISTNCVRVTYLEALDRFLSGIWKFFVCPSQNIFFGNWSSIGLQFSEKGQCVSSHQLPNKSQDQHFFALPNARTSLDMDRTPYFDIFYV